MITFTANDAKNKFGEVIDAALQGPVSITKHNRPSVVVMSDAQYQSLAHAKHKELKAAVVAGFDQLDRGEFSPYTNEEIAERVIARKFGEAT
ncbi:MAG: type II toxin-antitoxin system Phd/YefM family antitoxin [Verrucomicrobia bacterium]|nr:type II toxin-antitoxin system Phd/YefM family antitoxin [Verrucomicrobiota bacterium]MDA1004959.1 type II toxin-antitoxin system Phd/YefM family antitoxin [Verrucomicrobiota bacterium]